MKQIKDLPQATTANNTDKLIIQDASNNTKFITRANFLTGITGNSSSIQYAKLSDTKSNASGGGAITGGVPTTKVLNTVNVAQSWVSLSNNQFTLSSGNYLIFAQCPVYFISRAKWWLKNVTDNTIPIIGCNTWANADSQSFLFLSGLISISASKVFELIMQTTGTGSIYAQGVDGGVSGMSEIYTVVELLKI